MCTYNDLWTIIASFGDNILDGMSQRFRLLYFHLPASGLKLRSHPFLDLGMPIRPGYSWPESDLGLHVGISAVAVKGNRNRFRLREQRIHIPATGADEQESNDGQVERNGFFRHLKFWTQAACCLNQQEQAPALQSFANP